MLAVLLIATSTLAGEQPGYVSASDAHKCIRAAPGFRDSLVAEDSRSGCYTLSNQQRWLQLCPFFPTALLGADTLEDCEAFRAVAQQAGLFEGTHRVPKQAE